MLSITGRTADLVVDESDTFFFDHPYDHVPGILLFSGLLELAESADRERSDGRAAGRIVVRLRFTRFCELDRPTLLSCEPEPEPRTDGWRHWTVAARHEDREVCVGTFRFTDGHPVEPGPYAVAPGLDLTPAPAELAHRRRPENVMIGAPEWLSPNLLRSAVLTPPAGHPLILDGSPFRSTQEIVEAGRQFGTLLEYTERGRPLDTALLWASLMADIPSRVDRDVPLALDCRIPPHTSRARYRHALVDASSGAELGSLGYHAVPVDPEQYAEARSA